MDDGGERYVNRGAIHDIGGNESSKRKFGMRLLNIGIIMAVVHYVIGMIASIMIMPYDYEFPLDIWWTLMGTGASLLGITLIERFGSLK